MAIRRVSPAHLARALDEIERHVGAEGWDQPPRLYALALTDDLLRREPGLAERLGLAPDTPPASPLIPVEQELPDTSLDDLLVSITWPATVLGAALVVERIVLPRATEDAMPDDPEAVTDWAQHHPDRADVRLVVGVLRDGARSSVARVRGHEADTDLLRDPDVAPDVADALAETFTD